MRWDYEMQQTIVSFEMRCSLVTFEDKPVMNREGRYLESNDRWLLEFIFRTDCISFLQSDVNMRNTLPECCYTGWLLLRSTLHLDNIKLLSLLTVVVQVKKPTRSLSHLLPSFNSFIISYGYTIFRKAFISDKAYLVLRSWWVAKGGGSNDAFYRCVR